jgi:hypothetical protein
MVLEDVVLPGHPYNGVSGIRFEQGKAVVYDKGEPLYEAKYRGSAWDFWYNLIFTQLFPAEYWYFGSPWSGRVRVSLPTQVEDGVVEGLMQFVDEETDGGRWYITGDESINPLFPPYMDNDKDKRSNLPLAIVLSGMIYEVLQDERTPDKWFTVSSIVSRTDLEAIFPEMWLQRWDTIGYPDNPERNMRHSFCVGLGVYPPAN